MGVCIGCLFSAGVAGTIWGTGKVLEWQAEWSRRRAMAEVDRTTPCRGGACGPAEGPRQDRASEGRGGLPAFAPTPHAGRR